MRTARQWMTICALTFTLFACGVIAWAQTPPPQKQDKVVVETHERILIDPATAPTTNVMITRSGDASGFSFVSSEMNFEGKIVKGVPYSAEAVTETSQTLTDGNRIVHKSTANIYRDSEGRTRREQTLSMVGPWASADEPSQMIFINDPVAGINYMLDPRTHTARKGENIFYFNNSRTDGAETGRVIEMRAPLAPPSPVGAVSPVAPVQGGSLNGKAIKKVHPVYPPVAKAAGAQGPVNVQIVVNEAGEVISAKAVSGHPLLQQAAVDAAQQWRFTPTKLAGEPVKVSGTVTFAFALSSDESAPPPPPPPQEARESLGKQTIEGVEAEGTRTTVTIPAGAIGNERPIQMVSERWYSPELQTVVMTKHSDPRFGETTYRLTNINRSEPAHALFEVPADFTIKEGRTAPQVFEMRRTSNEKP